MRIGFLFNHDALHQVAHTAPVMAELARTGVQVAALVSSTEQEAHLQRLLPGGSSVQFVPLPVGWLTRAVDVVARRVAPFRRVAVLRENRAVLTGFDALVVAETTSALLKTHLGLSGPKLIYIPHGAGDRSVGFRDVTRRFDLVLLSGRKVRDRMLAQGLITPEGHAVVGYPKFDTVDLARVPRLFDNDRPTVLYNPHFDPRLSSWYGLGLDVLDWFAAQDRFNLVFAPHVMLFKRRLHASAEHRGMRFRRDVPRRFLGLPHVRIDTGSARSTDMTYTRGADIYLGDASSQVYEWIMRPRPCVFLDAAGTRWQGDPNYQHWTLGEVVADVAALPAALDRAEGGFNRFAAVQARAREETFALSEVPASRRAAEAILAFLER